MEMYPNEYSITELDSIRILPEPVIKFMVVTQPIQVENKQSTPETSN